MELNIADKILSFNLYHTKLAEEFVENRPFTLRFCRKDNFFISDELDFQPLTFKHNSKEVSYVHVGDVYYICELNRVLIAFQDGELERKSNVISLGTYFNPSMTKEEVNKLLGEYLSNISDVLVLKFK